MTLFCTQHCRKLSDSGFWFRSFAQAADRHRNNREMIPPRLRTAPGKGRGRAGAAVVEFAIVAPLLFMLVLGFIEFGRMMMVQQQITNCAREGARKAVLHGMTSADVYKTIDDYMSSSGISGQTRQVSPDPATAQAGTAMKVTVSVPYNSVSWLPIGTLSWLKGKNVTASAEMRKEE